jgi:hypothetical protein
MTFRPNQVVDLGAADGAAKGALDHRQRALAERCREFAEEPVGVGSREVPERCRADLWIDPLVSLAAPGCQRVVVTLDRVEPVLDALLDGVRGWRRRSSYGSFTGRPALPPGREDVIQFLITG